MRTTLVCAAAAVITCLAACATGSPAATPPSPPAATAAGSDASGFCALAASSGALFNPRDTAPDPTAVASYLPKALALAPAEIRPDVAVIVDIEQPIVEHRVPPGDIEQRLEDPRLDEAAQHVADYVQAHCAQ
jgi:hypothetical protein